MAKKTFTGVVFSTNMTSTVVVEVTRRTPHPMYRKLVKKTKKFKVGTNGKDVQVGQTVVIVETRPISTNKTFEIMEVRK